MSRATLNSNWSRLWTRRCRRGNHHGWALVMMVFFAVAREGLESVFFLLAVFQQDVGIWPPWGAAGLATAIVLGFLLYWGGIQP